MFQIDGAHLITDAGTVHFSHTIYAAIEMQEITVVLLRFQWGSMEEDNLFGVMDGSIIWRIQPQHEFKPYVSTGELPLKNPYGGMKVYEKNPALILAVDLSGFQYLVDPTTGKIVGEERWAK